MAVYNAPDVYIKDVTADAQSLTQAGSSVGLLIGKTRSGVIGVPRKVSSWTDYTNKFANGLDNAFVEDDYLSYAVRGFFTNGGSQLYILSLKKDAVKATATSETSGIKVTALNEGIWGNSISVEITKNVDWVDNEYETFDVTVKVGTSDFTTVVDLKPKDFGSILNNSKIKNWIGELVVPDNITNVAPETITLKGGTDGGDLVDADYEDALEMAKILDDLTFIAIPGQTSKVLNDALMSLCDNYGYFPFLDMPRGSTPDATRLYRKSISAWTGVLAYPWGSMNDPLTNTLKTVPSCGHLMGLYSRTIENSGIHKAPAGTGATIRGFVGLECTLTPSELGDLNIAGVVCIVSKSNAGIVSWGARSLNSTDTTLRYVTDGIINLNIKRSLYNNTLYAVFEPNNETLWKKVYATCSGFLESLRKEGVLKGSRAQAYFVKVDGSNNTPDTINEGQLNIDIGYAPVKPAEFIIFRLSHSIA